MTGAAKVPKIKKIYTLYIGVSLLVVNSVAGIQYCVIMDVSLYWGLFIFPTFVGLVFGYLMAKNRLISAALAIQASTDPLTKLSNRRFANEALEAELKRGKRYKSGFSLILFDIDDFKKINDTHGHLVGDNVLIEIAKLAQHDSRESDVVARWGGEEFMIFLPNTSKAQAVKKAESLRKLMEETQIDPVPRVTSSFGVAELIYDQDESIESITNRADQALYEAKHKGKNCVACH